MAGHHAGDLPGRPAGPVSTCSVPGAPRHRPAPRPQRPCRPPGPRRRRSRDAGQAAALGCGRPRASQPRPPPHHPLPVRPDAGRRPRRPPTAAARRPLRPAGAARHRATRGPARRGQRDGSAADTRACPAGHLEARTPGLEAPDTWMLEVRSTGWTDIPRRTGRGGQGNARPGRRPDILGPATPAGRPVKPSTSSHAGPVTPSRPAPQRPTRRRSRRPGRTACRPLLRSRCRPPRSGSATGRRPWPDQATRSQAATRPGCRRRQRPTAQVHATAPLSSLAPAGAWGSRTPYRRAWPSAAAAHPCPHRLLKAVAAGAPMADDDHVASRPTGVGTSLPGATNDRRRHHR